LVKGWYKKIDGINIGKKGGQRVVKNKNGGKNLEKN
jgi:hypothetical protein